MVRQTGILNKCPSPPTLRSLTLTSGLSPTPNRCISDYADAPSKFLASLGTSDIPQTLGEMPKPAMKFEDEERLNKHELLSYNERWLT